MDAKKKKKRKRKKKKKTPPAQPVQPNQPIQPAQCPANAQFCSSTQNPCNAAQTCGCASRGDGSPVCADCAHCVDPACVSDADCVARGLPAGTVCGDGTGGLCDPCVKVCLTPCGSCPNCSCREN
jgi:hypothetical protein